jgi:serpin B
VDFGQTGSARQSINTWVADQTEDKIAELIGPGVLTPLTRLVLTNAVYFKASWLTEFDAAATGPAPFTLTDGSTSEVQMMHNQTELGYAELGGWQAVELPYAGEELSLVALLPAADTPELDLSLDAAQLGSILDALAVQEVALTMPRFSFGCPVDLKQHLQGLGMVDAFGAAADFSGINGEQDLYVQAALHEAFIEVNEEGTEAAAATAVVVGTRSAALPALELTLDRPFLILIRDLETDAILFLGRVAQPE